MPCRPANFLSCFLLYLESTPRELFKTSKKIIIGLLENFSEHFQKNYSSIFGEIVNPQGISLRFPLCNNMLLHKGNLKEISYQPKSASFPPVHQMFLIRGRETGSKVEIWPKTRLFFAPAVRFWVPFSHYTMFFGVFRVSSIFKNVFYISSTFHKPEKYNYKYFRWGAGASL